MSMDRTCNKNYTTIYTQMKYLCKMLKEKPLGNGQAALKYLAPYIHRVAISNRRLLAFDNRGSMESSQVTFQFRAYLGFSCVPTNFTVPAS